MWHDEPTTFGALVPFVRPVLDRFRLLAGVSLAEPVTNVELLSVCAGLFLIVTCVMNSLTVCRYYIARSAPLSSHFNAFCELGLVLTAACQRISAFGLRRRCYRHACLRPFQ